MWFRKAGSAAAAVAPEAGFSDVPSGGVTSALAECADEPACMAMVSTALEALQTGHFSAARGIPGAAGEALSALADALEKSALAILKRTVATSWQAGETIVAIASMSDDLNGVRNNAGTISSAAEQLSINTRNISDMGNTAAADAASARRVAEESIGHVDTAGSAMNQISTEVRNMTERLNVLQRAVEQISEMTQTIEEISSQTNLLALNATIEAARAGEAGRGFAVVASEVKALSQQTADATEQIRDRTNALTGEMAAMMGAMQKNAESVTGAESVVADVSQRFHGVGRQIAGVSGRISEMATTLEEQTSATEEISKAIARIAAEAGRSRKAADNIVKYASETDRLILEQFAELQNLDIRNAPLEAEKTHHMRIKQHLAEMMVGFRELDMNLVPAVLDCSLTTWSKAHLASEYRKTDVHLAMIETHRRFHAVARAVLEAIEKKDRATTLEKYREMGDV
ncbi:MAG: methyl-accepting chemotaxis protein, partial [Hyphomicrobiales bacterium]|nr:methyl-accepting chemotaxis protein [Hyphomicrobiales bacterium]